jgi:hypothetical protein
MVPFSLFVSLSASDNVLPTMGSDDRGDKAKRQGMVKVLVDNVRDAINQAGQVAGLWRPQRDGGF